MAKCRDGEMLGKGSGDGRRRTDVRGRMTGREEDRMIRVKKRDGRRRE